MSPLVQVSVERLANAADLPLPAAATSGAAGVDLLAATIVGTSALTATAAATLTADDMTLLSLNPDLFLALAA